MFEFRFLKTQEIYSCNCTAIEINRKKFAKWKNIFWLSLLFISFYRLVLEKLGFRKMPITLQPFQNIESGYLLPNSNRRVPSCDRTSDKNVIVASHLKHFGVLISTWGWSNDQRVCPLNFRCKFEARLCQHDLLISISKIFRWAPHKFVDYTI